MAQSEPDDPPNTRGHEDDHGHGKIGRDLFWAYAAAGAKVASWVVVSGLVFRKLGAFDLGLLTLARATVGFLNYAAIGLAPALVHRMGRALGGETPGTPARPIDAQESAPSPGAVLDYANPQNRVLPRAVLAVYSNGLVIATAAALFGFIALWIYSRYFDRIHGVAAHPAWRSIIDVKMMVLLLGVGTLLRLVGDVPGALLQSTGALWLDYLIMAAGELAWAVIVAATYLIPRLTPGGPSLFEVALAYAISGGLTLLARWLVVGARQGIFLPDTMLISRTEVVGLLAFGSIVLLAQLADYLYAPTDFILIQHFLGADAVAYYAPAVQIDAALLLSVGALAMVVLPRAALAHGRGDARAIRRYYVRGTLASLVLLASTAVIAWLLSPTIFWFWLDDPMHQTQAILPLVLLHTVVGGSSAVGRSILLGIGRVKAYTAAALIAGVMNVALSYVFVRYFGWGLKGIVLGTICVVVGRCAIWMPWYVLRVTREGKVNADAGADPPQVAGYMGT